MRSMNVFLTVFCLSIAGCGTKSETETENETAAATHSVITNSIGMQFIAVPKGSFLINRMGVTDRIQVDGPLEFGVHEVTQAQFEAVMGSNPSGFKGEKRPVENMSWEQVEDFCRKLSNLPEEKAQGVAYRLPTEDEWAYVVRAGEQVEDQFDHHASDLGDHAWIVDNADAQTHDVGQKPANPWGIHDMYGTVWEWCNVTESAPAKTLDDPAGHGLNQVVGTICLGGSWDSASGLCHTGVSQKARPGTKGTQFGFRVVRVSTAQ